MNKKFVIPLIFIFVLVLGFLFFKNNSSLDSGTQNSAKNDSLQNTENKMVDSEKASDKSEAEEDDFNDDENLTPEEVLRRMDEAEKVVMDGPISIDIVSPEGDNFMQSQARMYEAKITNFPKNAQGECAWKFFLNQYDEEALYEEMQTQIIQSECGFTSTFIENRGDLRVVVKATIKDPITKEVLDEVTAERKYKVL